MLQTRHDAYQLLAELGAPKRLLLHLQLVGEAAAILIETYTGLGMQFDAHLIELGAAVHDAGKIQYPEELDAPGSRHEPAGEALLLAHGVEPKIARCCVSHAGWQAADVSFEERSIALADKLWKGKREEALELAIIDNIASQLHVDRWQLYTPLDSVFEDIAAGGADRLARSRAG